LNKAKSLENDESKDPLDNFFSPKSIAIVGASSKSGKIGNELVRNISRYQADGRIYPINPKSESILGLKCYPSITKVEDNIDLAIFVAQSNILPQLIKEAGSHGVKNAIIVSGGFKEMGDERGHYQDQVRTNANKHDMRIIGPNCIGVFDSKSKLDTFFYPGLTFLEWATNSKLGIRRLISLGNRCDVNEIDIVRYLGRDPLTKVIALHLESFSDGRQLIETAKEVSLKKPIILLKTGRVEGSKAAMSHTGSITGSYQVCKSVLSNSGMIMVETFEELFDISKVIEKQPFPKGKNVTIVTNAAGPSVAASDLLHDLNLNMYEYNPETLKKLRETLPTYAVIGEYVDLTGSATSEDYEKTFQILLEDPNIDAILNFIVFLNPQLSPDVVEVTAAAQDQGRSIVTWATGGEFAQKLISKLEELGIPTYPTSERAVKAIQGLIRTSKNARVNQL
jgi:3-hydroxypropionyl-CoA synthetase (ADP-forming)